MCFAPQRRALFRHLKCQKWSAPLVFLTFWLGNVLRATMACNFSSLLWPAGSAPAALASLLFDPPEPQIIGKTQRIATPTFSRISIFFLLTLSLLLFSLLISLLSASALLLCFSSVHIVGSLTSKLPSPMIEYDVNNIRLLFDIYTDIEVDKVSSARLLHQHQKLLHSLLELFFACVALWCIM